MTRKTPYRHPVKTHIRSGVKVINYERGKGRKAKGSSSNILGRRDVNYRIQIFYPSGSETYGMGGVTYVGVLKSGLNHLQTDNAPYRVHMKREVR